MSRIFLSPPLVLRLHLRQLKLIFKLHSSDGLCGGLQPYFLDWQAWQTVAEKRRLPQRKHCQSTADLPVRERQYDFTSKTVMMTPEDTEGTAADSIVVKTAGKDKRRSCPSRFHA